MSFETFFENDEAEQRRHFHNRYDSENAIISQELLQKNALYFTVFLSPRYDIRENSIVVTIPFNWINVMSKETGRVGNKPDHVGNKVGNKVGDKMGDIYLTSYF